MVRRPSVVVVVHNFKHEYLCNRGPITTKFYLKHQWVGGKAALGFGPDRIRTLVAMATESSHRVIMEKTVSATFSQLFIIRSFLYLQVMMTCMKAQTISKFQPYRTTDCGVSCPWSSEKIPIGLLWEKPCLPLFLSCHDRILFILAGNNNIHESLDEFEIRTDPTAGFHGNLDGVMMEKKVSATFSRLFFILFFSYLQVTDDMHESLDEFEFWTNWTTDYAELAAALECLKKSP